MAAYRKSRGRVSRGSGYRASGRRGAAKRGGRYSRGRAAEVRIVIQQPGVPAGMSPSGALTSQAPPGKSKF